MVIWITGLSGAGKTTLASQLVRCWREKCSNVVLLDGDEIRRILKASETAADYTLESRHRISEQIHHLCRWLDTQGIHVVCATISAFDDVHTLNRRTFPDYLEIFIDVPMDTLKQRDVKNLYGPAFEGRLPNVVGVDLPFAPPKNPDMTVDNSGEISDLHVVVDSILDRIHGA